MYLFATATRDDVIDLCGADQLCSGLKVALKVQSESCIGKITLLGGGYYSGMQ